MKQYQRKINKYLSHGQPIQSAKTNQRAFWLAAFLQRLKCNNKNESHEKAWPENDAHTINLNGVGFTKI